MSDRTAKGPTTIHELDRPQQAAGRRAAESRATIPDVAWTAEADLDGLDGPFDGALLAAVAGALRAHPRLNATYRDGTVVAHDRVNLAVVVPLAQDAPAPVVLDADERDAAALSEAVEGLRTAVAGGELTAAAFAAATFTVAGLGVEGVRAHHPPVTPGQVAVLAAGAPQARAVVRDGQVVAGHRADLVLVADARAVQGDAGAAFLRDVVARLRG